MDQDHTNPRKRKSGLNFLPNEGLCQCSCQRCCHSDHARERRDPLGSKRRKPEERLRTTPPPPSDSHYESSGISSQNVLGHSFHTPVQENTDIDPVGDVFSVFPLEVLPPYLPYDSQQFPQQNVGTPNDAVETSASCTITNATVSPKPLNWQAGLDRNDCTTQNPTVGNEFSFDDADDFNHSPCNESQWDGLSFGLLGFSDLDFEPPTDSPRLMMGLENNASSYLEHFSGNQSGRGESPFMPATFDGRIRRSNAEPWFLQQAIHNRTISLTGDELPHPVAISPEAFPPNLPQTPKQRALQPSMRSSSTSSTLPWNNETPATRYVQPLASRKSEVKLRKRLGYRDGPMEPKNAKEAKEMRKSGSCWPCKLVKSKCSLDDICIRCTKMSRSQSRSQSQSQSQPQSQPQSSSPSPSCHVLCYRGSLADYTDVLFSDLITSRFSEKTMATLITKTAQFTSNNRIEVEVSSGPDYPVIGLTTTEFKPLDDDFLVLDYVIPNRETHGQCQKFTRSYAPPIGLYGISAEELRAKCSDHIKCIIKQKRDVGEANYGDISLITLKAFEAVNKYRRNTPESSHSALLRKTVMLYAMNYFMSRIITLTKDSTEKVARKLQRPQSRPFETTSQASQILTSRLLNLQIKQAMQELLRDTTRMVLKGFEKEMLVTSKTRGSWADNFCIVLILCMCIEAIQVRSDSCAMSHLRRDPTCKFSRSQICRDLEYKTFMRLTHLLRAAYKTSRAKDYRERKMGFNPIRYGLPINVGDGVTAQMRTLVDDIKLIMKDHGADMAELVKDPCFDDPEPDILTHHMAFRKKNSGRLVSKFLLSF